MSIGTVLTSIGTFLSGPIMTGISNVATLGTLGVSIATKVDTHDIKSTVGGLKSDIAVLDRDILSLAGDISDMRQERYWSLALAGETPVAVTAGGQPTAVQLQLATPTVPVQQSAPQVQPVPTQTVQQAVSQPQVVQQAVTSTPTTPTTPVQPTQPAPVQTVTVAAPADQNQIAAFIAAMPDIIAQAVKAAMTPPPTTTTTTPETTTTTTSAPVTTPPATN